MSTTHGHRLLEPHQFRQHFCAAHDRQTTGLGLDPFRIVHLDGGRRDHDLTGAEIFSRMTDVNRDALFPQTLDIGPVILIRALHRIAQVMQDFCNGAHADAANANEMNQADIVRHPHGAVSFDLIRVRFDQIGQPCRCVIHACLFGVFRL